MHVEIATDIALFHELGTICIRLFNLALILTELRRNPVEPKRLIDALFGFAGHARVVVTGNSPYSFSVSPMRKRALPQCDVVLLAAPEILHRGAEALMLQRPHIDL